MYGILSTYIQVTVLVNLLGKYTRPMDPMGYMLKKNRQDWPVRIFFSRYIILVGGSDPGCSEASTVFWGPRSSDRRRMISSVDIHEFLLLHLWLPFFETRNL